MLIRLFKKGYYQILLTICRLKKINFYLRFNLIKIGTYLLILITLTAPLFSIAQMNSADVKVELLLNDMNGPFDETNPFVSSDENVLAFTKNFIDPKSKQKHTDILIYSKNEHNAWAKNITTSINSDNNEKLFFLTSDGLEVQYTSISESNFSSKLFLSKSLGNIWVTPEEVNFFNGIKGYDINSYCLNTMKDKMYFSGKKQPGGNHYDIFMAYKKTDGRWSEPISMGASINSLEDEVTPFIHPNGRFLYFSSNRKDGKGGFDIYKSELYENEWNPAINLPEPINSAGDDKNYSIVASGRTAYFCSDRKDGMGGFDIYKASLPKENIPLTLIKGRVIAKDGKIPAKIIIKIFDKEQGKDLYIYNPNPENGKYLMIFPPGKNYDMVVQAEGYKPYTFNIHVPDQSYYYQLQQTIYLFPDKMKDNLVEGIKVSSNFNQDSIADVKNETKEEILLKLIEKIIVSSDTEALKNMDRYLSENNSKEDKYYNNLLEIISKIIESGDMKMLENLEMITKRQEFNPELIIYFESNSATLSELQKNQIKAFCNDSIKNSLIEVSGHSDNTGTSVSKYFISGLRANSVIEFLINECKLSEKSILRKNFSDSYPMGDNKTEEGKKLNRRVEILIIK